jgi:predicted enzyme related to lactoylglutathione lyase
MRLNFAMLYVNDLPRMVAFYGELLRVVPLAKTRTESWAEFETGGARFGLHAIPAHIAAAIKIASPPVAREDTPIKLMFEVDDLEGELTRIEALGVSVIRRPWGVLDVVDPESNIFQVQSGAK